MSHLLNSPAFALLSTAAKSASSLARESAKSASSLARESLSAALETATVEYDETGRALVTLDEHEAAPPKTPHNQRQVGAARLPETPGSAATEGDLEAQIAALLDERAELQMRMEDELNHVRQQMMTRLEASEARARAALAREQDAEQRVLAVEVQFGDAAASQRRLQHENERLQAELAASLASSKAAQDDARGESTAAAARALEVAVEAEAERWRGEVASLEAKLAEAQGTRDRLQQEVADVSEAWEADQAAWRAQTNMPKADGSCGAEGATAVSAGPEVDAMRVQMDVLRTDLAKAKSDLAESQADNRSLLADLEEQDVGLDLAQTALTLAAEQRDGIRAEAQRCAVTASEQHAAAMSVEVERALAAEQRADTLASELDHLKEAADAHAAMSSASEQHRHHHQQQDTDNTFARRALEEERDRAHAVLAKTKGELDALRIQVLEAEESSSSREAELAGRVRELESLLAEFKQSHAHADDVLAAAADRARLAEEAQLSAQRRCAEQETALSNLQAVLEQMQLQSSGGNSSTEEAPQLRIGGQILVGELLAMEAELTALHRAQLAAAEVAPLREALDAAELKRTQLQEEVAGLQAMLRAANASHENDTSIDKRLVASVLVKYFERGRNDDVLAVLGSMLNCSQEEQAVLGIAHKPSETAHTDAKFSDMWVDFLLNEAERAK